jgi:hypothetical protein
MSTSQVAGITAVYHHTQPSKFLFAYNSCTGVHCDIFHTCLQYIVISFTPSIVLPFPPLGTILSFIVQFPYMNMKYFHHFCPPLPSLFTLAPPTGTYLWTHRTCFIFLSFFVFKVYIDLFKGFSPLNNI